jgi:DNA-cytosine methyltransferase
MNVLSLFDGVAAGRLALNNCNIKYNYYFASEIDKYAIAVTEHNFPNTIQLGDIRDVRGKDLPKINLIMGGSPCQGFSFAGNMLNFDDSRSKLFFEYVRLLNECQPDYFLLENVRMTKVSEEAISKTLGVKPILIDSSKLSAQTRKRLYWTNIPNVTQPEDKNILLKDIIESGEVDRDKSYCIDANYWKGGNLKSYFEKCRRQVVFEPLCLAQRGRYDENGKVKQSFEVNFTGKTNTLTRVQKDNYILKINDKDHIIRKLTPIECERLQTMNDNHTKYGTNEKGESIIISNTQRYKLIGNSWTVDIISHILNNLCKN